MAVNMGRNAVPMELFYHPLSRYSQKVLIALYEKQANFSASVVDLQDVDAKLAFQQVYAPAKLPLLKTQSGQLLPESSIIIEYVNAHLHGGTALLPTLPEQALMVRLFDREIDNDINSLLFEYERLTINGCDAEFELKQLEKKVFQQFSRINSHLGRYPWACGDSFTLADCALIPCLYYGVEHFKLWDLNELARYWQQAQLRGSWMLVRQEVERAATSSSTGMRVIP